MKGLLTKQINTRKARGEEDRRRWRNGGLEWWRRLILARRWTDPDDGRVRSVEQRCGDDRKCGSGIQGSSDWPKALRAL